MEHFVTIFDGDFLPQGLALIDSLERHAGDHILWVICLDDRARDVLENLRKANLRVIACADLETPELLSVKPTRTRAEYCWTLKPRAIGFVFERDPSARRASYIDADVFLLKSPRPIFEELEASGKSVLITDHAYDPEYDQSASSGRFCAHFMTFVRDRGEPVRRWWEERCIEWCFRRVEDGKFGDQKYLDEWPGRFRDHVHVLQRRDAIQAPWNARLFDARNAIAWHFHGLRVQGDRIRWYSSYEIPPGVEALVYAPYVRVLESRLTQLGLHVFQGGRESAAAALLATGKRTVARMLGLRARSLHRKVTQRK